MHTPARLDAGLRHRLPSSRKGDTTEAVNAAALNQMPRLNKAVFLKEMTCTPVFYSASRCDESILLDLPGLFESILLDLAGCCCLEQARLGETAIYAASALSPASGS